MRCARDRSGAFCERHGRTAVGGTDESCCGDDVVEQTRFPVHGEAEQLRAAASERREMNGGVGLDEGRYERRRCYKVYSVSTPVFTGGRIRWEASNGRLKCDGDVGQLS